MARAKKHPALVAGGPWHQLSSGAPFALEGPITPITIEDVASSLSKICRFAGASTRFYCPTEEMRILTEDLRWVPAGDLRVGDGLFAFDEHPHEIGTAGNRRRRYRPAAVLHAERVKRPIIRLEMSDGSCVRASAEHPWLVCTEMSRNHSWRTSTSIAETIESGRKLCINRYMDTWSSRDSWKAGWLSGIFDGEGHVRIDGAVTGIALAASQVAGRVLDGIIEAVSDFGFSHSVKAVGGSGRQQVYAVSILGGMPEILRMLGTIRPRRLLDKTRSALTCGRLDREMTRRNATPLRIVRAYREPPEWVAGLETSTHTYLCEGFGAHNSVAQHSVLVAAIVKFELDGTAEDTIAALLHDAGEIITGDIPRPAKKKLAGIKELEADVLARIIFGLGVSAIWKRADHVKVRMADEIALATERKHFMAKAGAPWGKLPAAVSLNRYGMTAASLSPTDAAALYTDWCKNFYEWAVKEPTKRKRAA